MNNLLWFLQFAATLATPVLLFLILKNLAWIEERERLEADVDDSLAAVADYIRSRAGKKKKISFFARKKPEDDEEAGT